MGRRLPLVATTDGATAPTDGPHHRCATGSHRWEIFSTVEYAALAADALEDATVAAGEREASEDAAARRALTDKRGAVGIA